MTLGELAEREMVSGNRVQPAGLLRTLRRQLIREVQRAGVIGNVKHADADDPFDCSYGTDTAVIVRVGGLAIPDGKPEHTNPYEAVMPGVVDAMIRELGIAYEKFFFEDIGAGKGRALLLASRFPFEGVLSIELSERLTLMALDNIRIFKDERQKCRSIHAIC
jgi:hypothetical protein